MERQDLSSTYLGHHDLQSMISIVNDNICTVITIIMIIIIVVSISGGIYLAGCEQDLWEA